MAFRKNSDWSLNKGTEDIVYSFLDGTTKRYRKLDGCIYEIIETELSIHTTELVPSQDLTVEQFDEIKKWSDEDYQEADHYEVHHSRGQVPMELVENTISASIGLYPEIKANDFRTVENALAILEAMKLTETQLRRFNLAMQGHSTRDIAKLEKTNQKSVWESLNAVEKKRQKIISKFFQKHPLKTPEK